MRSSREQINVAIQRGADVADEAVARAIVNDLSAPERDSLLVRYVADDVAAYYRERARQREREATAETPQERADRLLWSRRRRETMLEVHREMEAVGGPFAALRKAIDDFRMEVRLELTAELLGSSFALGDGSKVTWGDATADQHEQRIALLMANVDGNVRTIKAHQAALSMLAAAGSRCLSEVRVAA